ncbi:MAG: M14 metallopeptidase family protein [Planctomycetota bacterium]
MVFPRSRVAVAALLCSIAAPVAQTPITTPEAYLGHAVGADESLANYTQLQGYWHQLASESDRLVVEEIGTTSYGQAMVMGIVSSPANLARLEDLRGTAETLCRARIGEAEARELAAAGRAVVWIDAGLHATECIAGQNILELVYRMCARDDAETQRILDNVVLLVCPANPDGMELIANAYMATQRVGDIPVLYQRYVGHDNNRDFYMANMLETEAINRILYRRWYPQIIYNHHQTAPSGTIIFTPPFRDPFNYYIDPMVVRGIELVAAHMNARFAAEGKAGVISRGGASYSTWWNGGLRTTGYFHNMIGILTESFGRPTPTTLRQPLRRRLPSGDYPMPIETQQWHARQTIEYLQTANYAILDLAARYREELLLNIWRMGRNAIERGSADHWTPTPHLLAEAERRDEIERGAAEAASETEGGEGGDDEAAPVDDRDRAADHVDAAPVDAFRDPALRDARGYLLPADQADFAAATRLVNALLKGGVEVLRTTEDAVVAGVRAPRGSYVVSAAQAFRAHVLDMFEPQWHPHDIGARGEPVRPYDSAGWTPALSMAVQFERLMEPVEGSLEPVVYPATRAPGPVTDARGGWLFSHADSASYIATNRLLAAGEEVLWIHDEVEAGGRQFPPGTPVVRRGAQTAARVAALAAELGLRFTGLDQVPYTAKQRLTRGRVGLFDVYGGNMATGWTRWVLEQHEFDVRTVHGPRVHAGDLRADFDVLIFQTGLPAAEGDGSRTQRALRRGRRRPISAEDLEQLLPALPAFEDWSGAADAVVRLEAEPAIPALRDFVEQGGILLAIGNQASTVIDHFDLPIVEGTFVPGDDGEERRTRRSEFYIPTSLVRTEVQTYLMPGWGVPAELAMVFRRSPVFAIPPDTEGVEALVRYAAEDTLVSGWAIGTEHLAGKAAVVGAYRGKGAIYLFGADPIYRGQPQGSIKLFLNTVLIGGSERT